LEKAGSYFCFSPVIFIERVIDRWVSARICCKRFLNIYLVIIKSDIFYLDISMLVCRLLFVLKSETNVEKDIEFMKILNGIGVSAGIAISPAYVVRRGDPPVSRETISPDDIENEKKSFREALILTNDQLERSRSIIATRMGEEHAQMIDVQIMLLTDKSIIDKVIRQIEEKRETAAYVFSKVINSYIELSENTMDSFFKERIKEFRDLKQRVLSNLLGHKHDLIHKHRESRILVIDHLSPSETAQLMGSNYTGIICEVGGETSHIAIMARTMEIPAVLGVTNAVSLISPNKRIIIDGKSGEILVDPDAATIERHMDKIENINQHREILMKDIDKPAITLDGIEVTVASNIELPEEMKIMKKYHSKGVGLFRTELLYITNPTLPSEQLQSRIYQRLVQSCEDNLVIIRTFDVGGDKIAESISPHLDPNPFLGWRAIRIGLDYPHLLKTQIRAILRASAFGKCAIMFPMISSMNEIFASKRIVDEAKEELKKENVDFDNNIRIGIMVETPAAAILSDRMARHLDFLSIGTNDLVQYTLAVDRGNEKVSKYYQTYNPAVIELIKKTIDAGHNNGIWVGMCGEMAGKLIAVPMLLGMNLNEFSVNPAQIPMIKAIIRRLSYTDVKNIADDVLKLDTHEQVVNHLKIEFEKRMPESFSKFI